MNHTNELNRKSSNLMLVGIALLFIAIVFLAVIYAVGDRSVGKSTKPGDSFHTNPDEIVTSANALVYNGTMLGVIKNIDIFKNCLTCHFLEDSGKCKFICVNVFGNFLKRYLALIMFLYVYDRIHYGFMRAIFLFGGVERNNVLFTKCYYEL